MEEESTLNHPDPKGLVGRHDNDNGNNDINSNTNINNTTDSKIINTKNDYKKNIL